MKKRILSMILAICMVLSLCPTVAYAESYGNYEYSIQNDEVTITQYEGWDSYLEIPSEINGKPVTAIGNDAFGHCMDLEEVILPHTLRTIGIGAFAWCGRLGSINIPDSVTYIGNSAFCNCHSLRSIEIPYGVTSINEDTFSDCHSLESIIIPDSVTEIKTGAFTFCDSLRGVTLSENVRSIEKSAFNNCYNLASITVDERNPFYSSVNGVLLNKEQTTLIKCPAGYVGAFDIPESVTSINTHAFACCSKLEGVTIPNGIRTIERDAFSRCKVLKSITIPNSVEAIEENAFAHCESLESIDIPNSVTFIGEAAFYNCPALRSVVVSNNVTYIPNLAFNSCDNLESIFISNNTTSIDQWAISATATQVRYSLDEANGEARITEITMGTNRTSITLPAEIYGYPIVEVKHTCNGGQDTCISAAVCGVCGKVYGKINPENHAGSLVWEKSEAQHKKYWDCCNAVVVDYENHTWSNGVCSACEYNCNHIDADKNHSCDNGCDVTIGTHEDTNTDHACDYGCDVTIGTHEDTDRDHNCDYCGETLSQHSGGEATCTAKAVCEYCGEEYGSINHSNHTDSKKWAYNKKQHTQYWKCCRVVVVNYEDHTWNNGICSVCDYTCTHNDSSPKDHICDICAVTLSEHTGGTATCLAKAVCEYCGIEYGELDADNHTGSLVWEQSEAQHKKYWNCCNAVVVDYENHTWSNGVCSVCDYVCTHKDENPKDYVCDFCGKKYGGVTSEAEIKEAVSSGAELIKLLGDVKLSSTLDLTDKIVTIDLNGYVLTGNIQLADSSASPQSILTLIDSRPTATHSDSSLPKGGVVNGKITLSRGNGSVSHLYANGGTVTGLTSLPSYAGGIFCTSDTPTAFKAFVGNYGEIHGGIFYGGINESCIKEKTVTFMRGSNRYATEVVANGNKVIAPNNPSVITGYRTFEGWYNGDAEYTFGSTITESITLNAKFGNPITYNISYNLDGGTAVNETTYNIESEAITLNNPTRLGYTFTGWSGTGLTGEDNMSVTIATGSTGNRTYTAHWQDSEPPVISGITNGEIYCSAQTVTVSDNEAIESVTVNGEAVTLDESNQFILNPTEGTQTIVATDKAGNVSAEITVTVNDGHTYEWQSNNSQYWQKCSICGYETAKKDIPTFTIEAPDKVCRTQDCEAGVTLPEGITDAVLSCEFIGLGGAVDTTVEDGKLYAIVTANTYPSVENSFNLVVYATTDDGFPFTVSKTVQIQNEHTGGTATCSSKALCEVCGAEHGELNPDNHAGTEIRNAIQATCLETGYSGDIYCSGCGILLETGKITDIAPHTYQATVIEPTENKQGYTKYTCTYCGYSYIGDITDFASDNSVLIAALSTIEAYSQEDYSAQSFAELQAIYNQYSSMATGSYTQLEIDNAAFDLLTAISYLEPYLNLNVSAPNGKFTVSYNNEASSSSKHSLLFGTEIVLTATANDGYEFVSWYDTVNNLYFSKNAEYSFKLITNTSLKAVFVKEQSATLTFANSSNWVQSTVTKSIDEWNNVTTIDDLLPSVPYKYGYSNGRWVYDNAEVLAKLQTGENVTLIPEYDEDGESLPTPPSPKGYTPALDLYYKLDANNNVGSFVMAAGIPENCQLESVGIAFYYKNADEFDPTKFELQINNKMLVSRFNTNEIDDIYIVNLNNFTSKYNWSARGYVSYYDANGNLKTVYSNQINIVNREQV